MEILILKENSFVCSHKGGLVTFSYEDLISIECEKPLIRLRLNEMTISIKTTLCNIENHLDVFFVRVNRQVIVNMKYAIQIISNPKEDRIQLKNGLEYKISERKKRNVRLSFLQYV